VDFVVWGLALVGALILAGLGFTVQRRATRLRAALEGEVGDNRCVACGSARLEVLWDNAYRCVDCSYEGGSGLTEMQAAMRQAEIAAMTDEERSRRALAELDQAGTLLLAARGALPAPRRHSSRVGRGHMGEAEIRRQRWKEALSHTMEAQGHLLLAQELIPDAQVATETEELVGTTGLLLGEDVMVHIAGTLATESGIEKLREAADHLSAAVDRGRAHLRLSAAEPAQPRT
jgi:hypothetical protein